MQSNVAHVSGKESPAFRHGENVNVKNIYDWLDKHSPLVSTLILAYGLLSIRQVCHDIQYERVYAHKPILSDYLKPP